MTGTTSPLLLRYCEGHRTPQDILVGGLAGGVIARSFTRATRPQKLATAASRTAFSAFSASPPGRIRSIDENPKTRRQNREGTSSHSPLGRNNGESRTALALTAAAIQLPAYRHGNSDMASSKAWWVAITAGAGHARLGSPCRASQAEPRPRTHRRVSGRQRPHRGSAARCPEPLCPYDSSN